VAEAMHAWLEVSLICNGELAEAAAEVFPALHLMAW